MHPALKPDGLAVVTGAAGGIGFAIAERLASDGMRVVLFDRDIELLERSMASLKSREWGARCTSVQGDVTSEAALWRLEEHCAQIGPICLLVNNAAIAHVAGPWDKEEVWHRVMSTNFWSVLRLQQIFVERLVAQSGASAIVNVGAKDAITPFPGNAAYSVSKAAVRVLTEQLAHELRERCDHVTAHLLVPGHTFTPMISPGVSSCGLKPKGAWRAEQVADRMVERLSQRDFYILCEDNVVSSEVDECRIRWAADDLIRNRPALSAWHPDYLLEFERYVAART
jgi:NAD(P)-dependent dehydrogenase (short-subunit alcohol dehydrogenase family)